MNDVLPSFRTPAEQAAYAAVLADLAGRDRGDEAAMMFREPTDPDAVVVADAMTRAGSCTPASSPLPIVSMLHRRSPVQSHLMRSVRWSISVASGIRSRG